MVVGVAMVLLLVLVLLVVVLVVPQLKKAANKRKVENKKCHVFNTPHWILFFCFCLALLCCLALYLSRSISF